MEQRVEYNDYKFSKVALVKTSVMGVGYFFLMGMIFYHHIGLSLLASFGAIFYVKERKKKIYEGSKG